MNPTYRSTAHTDYGTGTQSSKTIAKPSGLAVDDILLAVLHLEPPSLQTVTATGFTVLKSALTSGGSNDQQMTVLWKRATSADVAATNFTFSWSTSVYNTGDLHAISGCTTATTPFSDSAILPVVSTTTTINSVSYTGAAGLGVWAFTEFIDGGFVAPPSGYTTVSTSSDGDLRLATRTDTTATTATGTGSHSNIVNYVVFAGTMIPPASNAISGLVDDFNDQSTNLALWTPIGSDYKETGSVLVVTPPSNGGISYSGYVSSATYDLTASSAFVQCVQPLNTFMGTEMYFYTKLNSSNYYAFVQGNGNLLFRSMVGNTADDTTYLTYDSATMTFWRIREQSGTIYWETAGNTTNWTVRKSITSAFAITALSVELSAGTYQNVTSPGVAKYDNLNVPSATYGFAWLRA